jgi:hypothetical protein
VSEKEKDKTRIMEGIEIIVDEAKSAAKSAMRRTGADTLGENLRETLEGALSARDSVVMVRLNKESLVRVDELVEADVVGSRSESAAFLIGEGIKARAELFERISEKIQQIRKAKDELRELLNEPPGGGTVPGERGHEPE